MPDTFQNASTSERPASTERRSVARPSGLPIFSTEPLTTAEKALLQLTARAHRRLADTVDQALAAGRVDAALAAMQEATRLAESDARIAILLGSNR